MPDAKLRIILVDELPERFELLEQALSRYGHRTVARISAGDDLIAAVEALQPDLIIVDLDSPGRDTLEHIQFISSNLPRPVVMFTSDGDRATIERAVKAGVSAYVVDGMNPERVQPLLDVAIQHFREFQRLRDELERTRNRLADRKVIERAKGILMKKRGIGEDEAYRQLQKTAMDRNVKLGELARSLIAAAELLD